MQRLADAPAFTTPHEIARYSNQVALDDLGAPMGRWSGAAEFKGPLH
jgi:hypothetical protein